MNVHTPPGLPHIYTLKNQGVKGLCHIYFTTITFTKFIILTKEENRFSNDLCRLQKVAREPLYCPSLPPFLVFVVAVVVLVWFEV